STILLVGIILNVVFSSFFDTPEEKSLKRENNQFGLQYEILNKKLADLTKVIRDIEKRDDNIYRVIFNTEPIPSSIRSAGFGGVNRYAELEGFSNSEIIKQTTQKLDKITKRVYVQSKSYDEVIKLALNKEEMLACRPAIQPVSNKDLTRMASGFGFRLDPFYKIRKMHWGMDFTAHTGTEIYATANGTVLKAKWSRGGYGNNIVIDHGYGYKTLYAHLSSENVKVGQKVGRGDVIGYVGNTGKSTAPHLHYEVILNNKRIDPVNFFSM
ncbi:unnamed protein product, partial [marine sediment metagenome]